VFTYLVMRLAGAAFNLQGIGSGWFDTLFGPTTDGRAWVSSWYVPLGRDLVINLFLLQGWNQYFVWLDGSYWTLPVQLLVFAAAATLRSATPWFQTGRIAGSRRWPGG
jgi:hypothetical protein